VFLDKTKVDEVYLTDHTFDMKVKVLDQTDDSIEFRIPPSVKPGRLQLLVKTAGHQPMLLEQPVFITVEEPKEPRRPRCQQDALRPAPLRLPHSREQNKRRCVVLDIYCCCCCCCC
jgi:hypothetical protein